MATYLSLYDEDQRTAVERVPILATADGHGSCRRCGFHAKAQSVCIEPEAAKLGDVDETLLVVGEVPGIYSDRANRPWSGPAGRLLREEVEKHWHGRVAFDTALKCYSGRLERDKRPVQVAVDKCRGYLHETIRDAKPDRIVALGGVGALALLGRAPPPRSVRKGFGFLGDGTPVFLALNPFDAIHNRFLKGWFKDDLAHALTCELPIPTQWDAEYVMVETPADARRAAEELREFGFGFDTETSGCMGDSYFRVLCLAACAYGSDYPWVWSEEALNDPALAEPLFDAFRDPRVMQGGHNIKHDILSLHFGHDVQVQGRVIDTLLDRRAIAADALARLDYVAELVGMGGHKGEQHAALAKACATIGLERGKRKKAAKTGGKGTMFLPGLADPAIEAALRLFDVDVKAFAHALVPTEIEYRYCALDTVAHVRIFEHQIPELVARKVEPVSRLMARAAWAYSHVEAWGIGASVKSIQRFNEYLTERKRKTLAQLQRYEKGFEPGKRDQVERMLFDVLKLPCRKKDETKSGKRGTGKDILRRLKSKHKFVGQLMEYRRLEKLLGTYAEGFLPHVRADGRIHPNVKVAGTETGRPSCENPNVQNLPRAQTVEGKMMRDCFIAPAGCVLMEVDYSQIEIRVGAMLSNEPLMISAFQAGEDLHWRTTKIIARDAWGMDPDKMVRDECDKQRSESKVTTFGLMYGKTAIGLADDLDISIERAQTLISLVLGGYPTFAAWADEERLRGNETGETWTWWDGDTFRRRPLWQIGDRQDDQGRPSRRAVTAENSTVNTPIQGTASDYCVHSLIEVVKGCIDGTIKAKVVITVHDSIMLEVREENVAEVARQVRAIMLKWRTLNGVPLAVDFKVGRSWGSLKGYSPESIAA